MDLTGTLLAGTVDAGTLLINGNPLPSSPWAINGNDLSYTLGNIGIGTASPSSALDVSGTINATNVFSSGSITSSGLSVNGNGTLTGSLAANSLTISGTIDSETLNTNTIVSSGTVTTAGISVNGDGSLTGNLSANTMDVTGTLLAGTVDAGTLLVNGNPLPSSPWTLNQGSLFYTSGNIGIGTNTPNSALDVSGTINANSLVSSGSITSSGLTVNGNSTLSGIVSANNLNLSGGLTAGSISGTGLTLVGDADISGTLQASTLDASSIVLNGSPLVNSPWLINGSTAYYNAGTVGIGTATPNNTYALDVAGTLNATNILLGGTQLVSSPWLMNGVETYFNGRVGIGTNNPNNAYALDINGTLNASNILIGGNALPSSPWSLNGTEAFYDAGPVGIGTNNPNNAYALDVNGTLNATSILLNGSPIANSGSSVWTLNGSQAYYTAGTVGVGTATPNTNYALDVSGTLNATEILVGGNALPTTPWTVNGAEAFYSGRIGIGNTNPNNAYALDVTGAFNAETYFLNGTAATPWLLNGTEAYYSGRVGIGLTNPNNLYALDVNGTINATEILVNGSPISGSGSSLWTQNGTAAYYNTGRVGVGTTTPAYTLDVAGTINATNILINGSPLSTGTGGSSVWSLNGSNDAFYTAGNVAIGANAVPAGYSLAVAGEVISEGVTVSLQGDWPDFVFDSKYRLPSLEEVAKHISDKGHLPNVPSALDVESSGINLGKMNAVLLQKIEELTLYTLQQQNEIDRLAAKNNELNQRLIQIESIQEKLEALEKLIEKNK